MTHDFEAKMASAETIFSWIEALAAMSPRLPTTDGGRQACEYLRDQFERMGLERITVEETPTLVWTASRCGLTVGDHGYPCHPISHSFSDARPGTFGTPSSGLARDVVYVGGGRPEDFEAVDVAGKIVVAEGRFQKMHAGDHAFHVQPASTPIDDEDYILNVYSPDTFPGNYYRAVAAGAVGFIGILSDYYATRESYSNEAYDAYNGSPLTIPALWVSPNTGTSICETLRAAGGVAAGSLVLEGSVEVAISRSVLGYLPGSGPEQHETIVVESHYDAVTPGAVQDASGISAVLALADYFTQVPPEDRNRTLLFCAFDTHSGDYAAHHNFVESHVRQDEVVFATAIEHIGKEVEDGPHGPVATERSVPRILWVLPVDELVEIAVDAVKTHGVQRTTVLSADYDPNELASDADYIDQAGVPVLSLVGVPMYLYGEIDTPDKVDRRQLRPTAQAFAEAITRIDRLPSATLAKARRARRDSPGRQSWISRQQELPQIAALAESSD